MKKRRSIGREQRREEEHVPEVEIVAPSDPMNEMVVIGAMLVDLGVCDRLRPLAPVDAFQVKEHKIIREAIEEARSRKLELDPATLSRLRPDVDIRILEQLPASRPDVPPNLNFHVDTLLLDWRRAQATRGPISALLELVQDPNAELSRLQAVARQVGAAFDGKHGAARFLRDPKDVIREAMATLRKRAAGEAWYPFGIAGLDHDEHGKRRHRPGAAPGQTTILTAASGSGKSTFAAHMIKGVAAQGRRVLVGAWEVRAPMTLELISTIDLGWSRSRTLDGRTNKARDGEDGEKDPLSDDELDEMEAAMTRLSEHITFVENPFERGKKSASRSSNDEHIDALEEHIHASGAEMVVLDLFDRVLRDRHPDEEQEALWRTLEMCNDLQVHLVLVHQQLIKGENVRADNKPSLKGLKGSSAYVDAGALILAPHLPARWKNVPDDTMELYALKQRYAPPFAVEFDWDPDTGQIRGGTTIRADEQLESSDEAFGIGPGGAGPRSSQRGGYARPSLQRKRS